MTRFVFQGSGHTTGGGGAAAAVVAVIAAAAIAEAGNGAARTLGEFAVIGASAAAGLLLGVVTVLVVVRARGRRRASVTAQPGPQLWHANPQAIPVQPRRELAAPAPVNVIIDAGLLTGLLREAQRPPVIIPSEPEELPR